MVYRDCCLLLVWAMSHLIQMWDSDISNDNRSCWIPATLFTGEVVICPIHISFGNINNATVRS